MAGSSLESEVHGLGGQSGNGLIEPILFLVTPPEAVVCRTSGQHKVEHLSLRLCVLHLSWAPSLDYSSMWQRQGGTLPSPCALMLLPDALLTPDSLYLDLLRSHVRQLALAFTAVCMSPAYVTGQPFPAVRMSLHHCMSLLDTLLMPLAIPCSAHVTASLHVTCLCHWPFPAVCTCDCITACHLLMSLAIHCRAHVTCSLSRAYSAAMQGDGNIAFLLSASSSPQGCSGVLTGAVLACYILMRLMPYEQPLLGSPQACTPLMALEPG
eukprot:1157626-Pelagomonas_calceolata.AAC.12